MADGAGITIGSYVRQNIRLALKVRLLKVVAEWSTSEVTMHYQNKSYRMQGFQSESPVPSFNRLLGDRFCELTVAPRIG